MEEEKQQLLTRISRLNKRVETVPNADVWLSAARRLRMEQAQESQIIDSYVIAVKMIYVMYNLHSFRV